MSKKIIKPASVALGTVLLTTLSVGSFAAENNPFVMKTLSSGYMQLASADDAKKNEQGGQSSTEQKKDGYEGKCGEGKCGEGKCGSKDEMKKNMEGKCGGKKVEQEGKCGEGKCGNSEKK